MSDTKEQFGVWITDPIKPTFGVWMSDASNNVEVWRGTREHAELIIRLRRTLYPWLNYEARETP